MAVSPTESEGIPMPEKPEKLTSKQWWLAAIAVAFAVIGVFVPMFYYGTDTSYKPEPTTGKGKSFIEMLFN